MCKYSEHNYISYLKIYIYMVNNLNFMKLIIKCILKNTVFLLFQKKYKYLIIMIVIYRDSEKKSIELNFMKPKNISLWIVQIINSRLRLLFHTIYIGVEFYKTIHYSVPNHTIKSVNNKIIITNDKNYYIL